MRQSLDATGARSRLRAMFRSGLASPRRRSRRAGAAWGGCRSGTSAVEFALLAPVLVVSLLCTVDLGMGLGERMSIEHVLRSGAQRALSDPGETSVTSVMQTTGAANFPVATGPQALAVSTSRFCTCPGSTGVQVACPTICAGSVPTYTFYRMTARKTYSGRVMPAMTFDRAIQVEVR